MDNTSFKILILLCGMLMCACNKEPLAQREYVYAYKYSNNCGGSVWMTVPNTFAPFQQHNGWFPSIIKLTADSSCAMNLPDGIRQKKYLTLEVEVRDVYNGICFQYHSVRDSVIRNWDGRIKNSSGVSPGIYYWHTLLQDLDGITHEESGVLHVMY